MNIEGRKITVNKSAKALFEMLKNPEDYRHLMPENLSTFEAREDGFKFGLKGLPEVALKISELVENEKVVMKSAGSSLDFSLTGFMKPLNENQTEVQLVFDGNFNPFIKMMAEKPLKNLIETLTDKLEQI